MFRAKIKNIRTHHPINNTQRAKKFIQGKNKK
jgi:hypothetical protein